MTQPKNTTEQDTINELLSRFYNNQKRVVENIRKHVESRVVEFGLMKAEDLPRKATRLSKYENLLRIKHVAETIGPEKLGMLFYPIDDESDEDDYSDVDEGAISL